MIAFLKGKLVQLDPTYVWIDVNGVGYHVNISLQTFAAIKEREEIKLFTHLVVREDAHVLYGFNDIAEKKIFLQLIAVNGVGANTAIVILSYLSINELKSAIMQDDVGTLQAVKGIGSKTAQRIIIELKDRLKKENVDDSAAVFSTPHNTLRKEALSALLTLGLPKGTAEKSVDAILKKSGNTLTLEDLVKQALKNA